MRLAILRHRTSPHYARADRDHAHAHYWTLVEFQRDLAQACHAVDDLGNHRSEHRRMGCCDTVPTHRPYDYLCRRDTIHAGSALPADLGMGTVDKRRNSSYQETQPGTKT
ncbi:MAG: hypothetical protein EHM41_15715 [Chloroflexi bacterium]|nr:MAG: hypothetical protein EHM41_15715 [Chloroflexota bacterium]